MNIRFEAIALTGNYRDRHALESIGVLAHHLLSRQIRVQAAAAVSGADLPEGVVQVSDSDLTQDVSLIIAVGGDGTMLYAARQAAVGGIPLLGINRGRLGFLAAVRA